MEEFIFQVRNCCGIQNFDTPPMPPPSLLSGWYISEISDYGEVLTLRTQADVGNTPLPGCWQLPATDACNRMTRILLAHITWSRFVHLHAWQQARFKTGPGKVSATSFGKC